MQSLTELYNSSITSDGTPAKRIKVGNDEAYLFTDEGNYHGIVLQKDRQRAKKIDKFEENP